MQFHVFEYFPTTMRSLASNSCKAFNSRSPWLLYRKLATDIISALEHLRRHNTLHLDVRLENILVEMSAEDTPLRAILCDFGCAKTLEDGLMVPSYVGAQCFLFTGFDFISC